MLGLTSLGVIHTGASLIALPCGFWSLYRYKEILFQNQIGKVYLGATAITAATSLGLYVHAKSFSPPHALGVLALLALLTGTVAAVTNIFGRWSRYMQALSYSSTLLFHVIPGTTEALIRMPPSHPILTVSDTPIFVRIYLVLFLTFLIGLAFQMRWLWTQSRKSVATVK